MLKKNMGFGRLLAGMLFLCNPTIALIDILPDGIGILLILSALRPLADLNGEMVESLTFFRRAAWVSFGALAAEGYLYLILQKREAEMNRLEMPVLILVVAFTLAVFELLFLLPALRHFFRGCASLAERSDQPNWQDRHRRAESMMRLCGVFVRIRAFLSVLPEFSVLTSFENEAGNKRFGFDWYRYIHLFRTVALLLSAIICIVFAVRIIAFFAHILRDRKGIDALYDRYRREVLTKTGMLTVRRLFAVLLLFSIGLLFSINLKVDFYPLLPGAVLACLMMAAKRLAGERLSVGKGYWISACLLFVIGLVQIILNFTYLSRYLPEASLYSTEAYRYFLILRIAECAEAAATIFAVYMILRSLLPWIRTYAVVQYQNGNETLSRHATGRLQSEFEKRILVIFLLFFSAFCVNTADAILQLSVGWLWLVSLFLSSCAIFLFFSLRNDLMEQIRYYYQPVQTHKSGEEDA